MSFINSLEKNKPAFFHFLDGYLNEKSGSQTTIIQKFITDNNIVTNDIY